MDMTKKITQKSIIIIMVGFMGLVLVINLSIVMMTQEELSINVVKTERVTNGTGDTVTSKYLVFTEEETFENTDSLLVWKFNSSDIYAKMKPGRIKVRVYGFRIPIFSSYRNIISIEE